VCVTKRKHKALRATLTARPAVRVSPMSFFGFSSILVQKFFIKRCHGSVSFVTTEEVAVILYSTEEVNSYPSLPYFLTDFCRIRYKRPPVSNYDIRENRCRETLTYFTHFFLPIRIRFVKTDLF
jgi:hypothetical protein